MSNCIDETANEIVDKLYRERERLFRNLQRVRKQLEKYDSLLKNLRKTNVSTDCVYQTQYNGFYRMGRRTTAWYAPYFALLQREKNNPNIDFSTVIQELYDLTNRVEPSFSSKLVATIRPNLPVYDVMVRKQMRVKVPRQTMPNQDRVNALIAEYKRMIKIGAAALKKTRFNKLRDNFKEAFPTYRFTDAKILDLMMWQVDRS